MRAIDAMTRSEATIAVITPYKAQKLLITKKLGNLKENWTVRTVDASQGSYIVDVLVVCTCRVQGLCVLLCGLKHIYLEGGGLCVHMCMSVRRVYDSAIVCYVVASTPP